MGLAIAIPANTAINEYCIFFEKIDLCENLERVLKLNRTIGRANVKLGENEELLLKTKGFLYQN